MPNAMTVELPDLASRQISVPGGVRELSTLPFRGITVLAVEDSRFASEALRLMCQRLGARLRRAETIQAARSHLRLYRPNLVIVDLGLPDGRGEALIREIVMGAHPPVVLGTSGDSEGRALALAAGAAGFLDKPMVSLADFQTALIHYLPEAVAGLPEPDEAVQPDKLALRDDLVHAATMIDAGVTSEIRAYLTGFLTGVARHADDTDLVQAVREEAPKVGHMVDLRRLLDRRLAGSDQGFGGNSRAD